MLQRPRSVSEFQRMFAHIYNGINKTWYSDEELIRRLLEVICSLMEPARKDEREGFGVELSHVFSWYNAVANRFNINLTDALWKKYPGVCTYCMRERDCSCAVEHPEIENKEALLRGLRRDRAGREPLTLRAHQELHARLYGRQNARIFPIQITAHLAEEGGEVSKALRYGNLEDAEEEMADIASWIFALGIRLGLPPIDELVWKVYPYECPLCHHDQCRCEVKP